ncbi:sensor domain-containing protein [Halobaculum magnesiiphilum]|uniref:Sensor domain-containing protein n=1 Tax=Halobaculum magnesiiphilum TaxID=1017351 RepID=A0A8T8WDS9_9EURY|nr:sensor domain-containing protein [Halobaculum magnesiiphilum]QZP38022.1 sensor domain-containing protein [Halobaculum magnesiiphilum]
MTTTNYRDAFASFAGAPLDPRTYRSLLYLALAVPLGFGYLIAFSAAGSLTLGLSVTILAPVAVLGTLLLAVAVVWADAKLTAGLLGVEVSPWFPSRDLGIAEFCKRLVFARPTWTGLLYLCWRMVLAVIALVVLTTGLSLASGLLVAPLAYGEFLLIDYQLGVYRVNTLPRALGAAGLGALVGLLTLYAANLLGRVAAAVTSTLVDDSSVVAAEGNRDTEGDGDAEGDGDDASDADARTDA